MADAKKCDGIKMWRCKKCGHKKELLCKKPKPKMCENCGHANIEQVGKCSSKDCNCPEKDKKDGCGSNCGDCGKQSTFELDPNFCGPKRRRRKP